MKIFTSTALGSSSLSTSTNGHCNSEDFDCLNDNVQDRLGMEAIASLHRQLDDDDNGNIDLSESDDVRNYWFKLKAL